MYILSACVQDGAVKDTKEEKTMKKAAKIMSWILAAAMLFGSCPAFAAQGGGDTAQDISKRFLLGDLTRDGKVTVADVMEGCRILARKSAGIKPNEDEMARGDVTGDGSFNISDIMGICKILARGHMEERLRISLNEGWRFQKSAVDGGMAPSLEDGDWEAVTVPHSYNDLDGQDGPSTGYYRGDAWYRKWVEYSKKYDGKRLYLVFEGTAQSSEVYLNGELVGRHMGGFTTYRFDVTDRLKTGKNLIAVKVNNQKNPQLAPQGGDFTIQGGMYRDVYLTVTDEVHVDMLDNGSDGIYLSTPSVSAESAALDIRSKIVNDGAAAKTVTVEAELRNPAPGSVEWIEEIPAEWLPFDPADMTPGGTVATVQETFTLEPGESVDFMKQITVRAPRLWDGLRDPYRYEVNLRVLADGRVVDDIRDYTGFRTFEIDYDTGSYLNGRSYQLRGVDAHQDWQDLGYALTKENFDQNMGLIYEVGANSVRLAHYPHCDYTYELCDQYGIMVWAEAPFVGGVGGSGDTWETMDDNRKAFFATTEQQLRELILQQYNRPSIFCWSMYNEIDTSQDGVMRTFSSRMSDMIHEMDPYRYSTFAAHLPGTNKWEADLVGWNIYPGWYTRNMEAYGETIEEHYNAEKQNRRPLGISEYGAGANIEHHADWPYPVPAVGTADAVQTEEYQALVHEYAIKAIDERPYLWGTYIWNMFDFAVDSRNEGGIPGRNNKGLVTYDRQVKKDAFYLYKANWSDIPFVEIGSKRYNPRLAASIMLKVYSNCESLELFVDGESQGVQYGKDLDCPGVYNWEDTFLKLGDTEIRVVGTADGKTYEDTVTWTREKKSDNIDLYSGTLKYDNALRTVALNEAGTTVETFMGLVGSKYNAALTMLDDSGSPVAAGPIGDAYRLRVVSEDGSKTVLYKVLGTNLCREEGVRVETDGYGERNEPKYMIDGDPMTRWQANTYKDASGVNKWRYPEYVTLDLGRVYDLSHMMIDWYNPGGRIYAYQLEGSLDGNGWALLADKTGNKTAGTTADSLEGAQARYIRIKVTGNSNAAKNNLAVASIHELYVYGLVNDAPSSNAELLSQTLTVNQELKTVELQRADTDVETLLAQVRNAFGAALSVVDADGRPAADGIVEAGWQVKVAAADGSRTAYYRVLQPSLTAGAVITASSWNKGENHPAEALADRDPATRWAADPVEGKWRYPEWVLFDLGDTYALDHLIIDWFATGSNNRVYAYKVEISEDGQSFSTAVDRTGNADIGRATDLLDGKKARWLRITVTGCNHQQENKLALASIWDVYLYGVRAAPSFIPSADTSLESDRFAVDNAAGTIKIPEEGLAAGELLAALSSSHNAAIALVDEDGKPVTEGLLTDAMRVKVTAEDKAATAYYTLFLPRPVFSEKVTAATSGPANPLYYLNDGKTQTRWAADNAAGKWDTEVVLDLGAVYELSAVQIDWFVSGSRAYAYTIECSVGGDTYAPAVDRSHNTEKGSIRDDLKGEKARFIKIRTTGCSDMETNAAAVPSIYEIYLTGVAERPSGRTDLYAASDLVLVDNEQKFVGVPTGMNVEGVLASISGRDGAKATVLDADGGKVTTGVLPEGGVIRAEAEDATRADYRLTGQLALTGEDVTVSSNADQGAKNNKGNLVDGDRDTRWNSASSDGWNTSVVLDLGAVCDLEAIRIDWYDGDKRDMPRVYYYEIYISDTGKEGDYVKLIDRTAAGERPNDRPGESMDALCGISARYVMLRPTGANDSATYPNIWEICLYGGLPAGQAG